MQVIVEIPYVFTQGLYYTLIVYSMMSFQWTVSKFFWFFFISFTSFLYFTYYGMMMVSITPNQHFAAIFASTFYSLFNLFSGFFIPKPVSFYNHIDCIFFPLNRSLLRATAIDSSCPMCCRKFPTGGSGTIGFVHCRGQFTG